MPVQISNALIARAKAGESAAIGVLYDTYQAEVYRYLYYRVGERQTAEDLTTEVFIKMIDALPRFRLQKNRPFRAWLMAITRNLAIDHHRRSKTDLELQEHLPTQDEKPEAAAERNLMKEDLKQALLTLTVDQRDVIILRILAEVPISQVAKIVDKSETAVKALQRRGLQALRKTLENREIRYG